MPERSPLSCNLKRYCLVRKAAAMVALTRKGTHSMADHSINGKTVIIAGGAKNLGGLIARDLAAHGARAIAIHYNSAATKADADATVAAVEAAGAKAVALQADLTTAGAVEKLFADAVGAIGKP